jgi:hypothetical protein
MREKHSEKKESKGICYEALEEFAREKIRQHLQYLLEDEVTESSAVTQNRPMRVT